MIRDRSRSKGITQDPFVGEQGAFQYAENINCFDDLRGIKLANAPKSRTVNWPSILLSCNGYYISVCKTTGNMEIVDPDTGEVVSTVSIGWVSVTAQISWAVIFDWSLWLLFRVKWVWALAQIPLFVVKHDNFSPQPFFDLVERPIIYHLPHSYDWRKWFHYEDGIEHPNDAIIYWVDTPDYGNCISVLNNSKLLVGNWNWLRHYDPDDDTWPREEWTNIHTEGWTVCTKTADNTIIKQIAPWWEYTKLYISNGWDSSVWFYQSQFDMEMTGLMSELKLNNINLEKVYTFGTVDFIGASQIDWWPNPASGEVANAEIMRLDQNALEPVSRLREKKGLIPKDVQNKVGHFVGPLSENMAKLHGRYYIADSQWVYECLDTGGIPYCNMKRKIGEGLTPYWLCIAGNWLIVNYDTTEYCMRLYDTGFDGYMQKGTLISRVIETEYWGEITKTLGNSVSSILWLCQYEFNNLSNNNGKIEIYVSFNRQWNAVNDNTRIKIGEVDGNDTTDFATCVKKFTKLWDTTAEAWKDFQTIEYKIVITRGSDEQVTPVVRSLVLDYERKEKTINF